MEPIAESIVSLAAGQEGSKGKVTITAAQATCLGNKIKGKKTPAGSLLVSCEDLCRVAASLKEPEEEKPEPEKKKLKK